MAESSERISLGSMPQWRAEALSRYEWVAEKLSAGCILDIACGSGLGSTLLDARIQGLVVGADLEIAGCSPSRVKYVQCDAHRIPFATSSFDCVTTFETIEHLTSPREFLRECQRVLKPDGTLFLSTPNGRYLPKQADGSSLNPYHLAEFDEEELITAVGEFFEPRLYGQHVSQSFGICPFWQPRSASGTRLQALKCLLWKLITRLPHSWRNRVANWVLRQDLYPSSRDFVFLEDESSGAHCLFVVARPRTKSLT
jgi:SAM-dependent methyltransferase